MWSSVSRGDQACTGTTPLSQTGECMNTATVTPLCSPTASSPFRHCTHIRDRPSEIGRTVEPIDAANQAAIVAHSLGKSCWGIGHMLDINKS